MSKAYNLFLEIGYQGTDFSGSQIQENSITIQEHLNRALQKLFAQEKVKTIFSGRTDAGVHAAGQGVTVKVYRQIPVRNVQRALNSLLPDSIRVRQAAYKPLDFHAQISAQRRSYVYNIYCGALAPIYLRDYVWELEPTQFLNIRKMQQAARMLKGTRDFSAVCAANSSVRDKVRTVYRSELKVGEAVQWLGKKEKAGKLISYHIEANGFLYHMVRNIVSALVDIGSGSLSLQEFEKILNGRNRTNLKSITAPPEGLALYKVSY